MFIIEKYVKIRFKNRGSPCYFLSSRGQKIKNITKIEQKRLLLFTFLVSFFMAFLAQKLIYTINIWFNFVFGSFFEQDHLLNLFILRFYAKRWPKCARILKQKLRAIQWGKKYGGYEVSFWKSRSFVYAELNETVEATTSSYSATGEFLRYIYSVLVAKNHQKIRSRCLVHEFFFTDIFLNSILYGFVFLLLLWKGAQNNAHCNYIVPP